MSIQDKPPYVVHAPMSPQRILEEAADIIANKFARTDAFSDSQATMDYLSCKLVEHEREVFAVMLLDTKHQLIEFSELFYGTIDSASVYPREVAKLVLMHNAAAVIFAHNHPSGCSEPSQADIEITHRLISALALIDVRVLDHIVVGSTAVSFAQRGLI